MSARKCRLDACARNFEVLYEMLADRYLDKTIAV